MPKLPFLIGITGVAGCGKDTLARILCSKLPKVEKWSIASILREDMEESLKKIGVDVWTEDRLIKEQIRPLMVEQANVFRKFSNGSYFWKKLEEKILKYSCAEYIVLTDVRNAVYEDGEDAWVKRNGIIIHLSAIVDGVELLPKNNDEALNDPILRGKASIHLQWTHGRVTSDEEILGCGQNKNRIERAVKKINLLKEQKTKCQS